MMNSLPMMYSAPSMAQLAVFLGANLFAGLVLLKRKRAANRFQTAGRFEHYLPMSAFSNADHPALLAHHEDVNPLTEAEIYVIYGRKKEAQQVLDVAVQEGAISPEQVIRFWFEQGNTGRA